MHIYIGTSEMWVETYYIACINLSTKVAAKPSAQCTVFTTVSLIFDQMSTSFVMPRSCYTVTVNIALLHEKP